MLEPPNNWIEDALQFVEKLEANDTLEGYRGARKIRDMITKYETKVAEKDAELHKAADDLVAAIQERIEEGQKWQAAEKRICEALEGCLYCKRSNVAIPYCHGCLESIAKEAQK